MHSYIPEITSFQPWSISSMFTLNQETQNLFKDCVENNYGNGITLIEKGKNFMEFVHICADSGYEKVDPYLTNNIDLLWNYVLYIREALARDKDLKKAYDIKYQYNLQFPINDTSISITIKLNLILKNII